MFAKNFSELHREKTSEIQCKIIHYTINCKFTTLLCHVTYLQYVNLHDRKFK